MPIYKRKGDVTKYGSYRGIKLEHATQIVERKLEERLQDIVNPNELQFGSM